MNDYILEMKNVSKNFGGVRALSNVSIDLKSAEIHAVVGENGAGKSTLMKILSGDYPYNNYSGQIIINGEPRRFFSPVDSVEAGIEMIYQEISVHLDLSVAENIFLGRIPTAHGRILWKKLFHDAEEYTRMVGLDVSVKQTMRNLSTSQKQMVTIARSLSRDPKILILDEPTSALTESEVETLFENLFKLKERGISCIYITHKMKEVIRLADRVTVLRDGHHISTRHTKDTSIDSVVEEMVNRKIENMYPKETVPLGEEILRVEDLVVPHPFSTQKNIVNRVSFCVRAGEILGIVGLVGAGRSEIVNAVSGAIKSKEGAVFIKGKPVVIRNPHKAIDLGIALLSEDRKLNGLVHTMSIMENISLASIDQISDYIFYEKKRSRLLSTIMLKT